MTAPMESAAEVGDARLLARQRVATTVVVGVVAILFAAKGRSVAALVAVVVGALAVQLTVLAPAGAARAARAVDRGAHALARALSTLLLGVVEAVVIVPGWVLSRVGRRVLDGPARRKDTAWASHEDHPDRFDRRAYTREPSTGPRLRRRLVFAGLVVLVLAAGIAAYSRRTETPAAAYDPLSSAALRNQPDASKVFAEQGQVDIGQRYAPFVEWALPDHQGEVVNVTDGTRDSWRPGAGPGRTLRVWFFGASSLYGRGQADDKTIPSMFAKEAYKDGIRVEATNFGVSGYSNYQSTLALALALDKRPPPDLVVFYDGYNETAQTFGYGILGAQPDQPSQSLQREFGAAYQDLLKKANGSIPPATPVPVPKMSTLSALAKDTIDVRQQGTSVAEALAQKHGFALRSFWQPNLHAKRLLPEDQKLLRQLGFDPTLQKGWRNVAASVREQLPPGITDLSTVFDDIDQPVFYDDVHTNELGAEIVGSAIYQDLAPSLREIATRPAPAGNP